MTHGATAKRTRSALHCVRVGLLAGFTLAELGCGRVGYELTAAAVESDANPGPVDVDGAMPSSVCGDTQIGTGEACDDGNTVTEDCACDETSCTVCGSDCSLVAGQTSPCIDAGIDAGNTGSECGNNVCEDGEDCASCAADCGACPAYSRKLASACFSSSAAISCDALSDDNLGTAIYHQCAPGDGVCTFAGDCAASGCVRDVWIAQDLGSTYTIGRVRLLSDWWAKKPNNFEIWASDDATNVPFAGATLVASGVTHINPWACVTGESCADEAVPDPCCPNGRDAPQEPASPYYAKYDTLDFAAYGARYWFVVVRDTYDPKNLIFVEIEYYSR